MSGLDLGALGLPKEGDPAPEVTPAPEATPPAAEEAPTPASEPEVEEEIEVPAGAENPDAVRNAIAAERAAARQAYKRAREAEAKLAAIEEAALPVEERLAAQTKRAEAAALEATRLRVGMKHGLPLTFAEMLKGEDEATLETNAKAVLAELQQRSTPSVPGLTLNGGASTPPPPPPADPGAAHNNFLLGIIGRQQPGA